MGDIFNWLQTAKWLSPETGLTSWSCFCLLVILSQTVLVPVSPFSIYAGFAFGFSHGTVLIVFAKMLSSLVNFSLSRWIARAWGIRLANKYPLVQGMNEVLVREGLRFAILLRLCPVPFSIANYGYGLTKMPLRSFVIATFVSVILPSATLAGLGASLQQGLSAIKEPRHNQLPWQAIATGISLLAVILVSRRVTMFAMQRVRETKSALDGSNPPTP
jgi:uncharacterized membrane protein YdjX (TVP38/TMEM64 family)